MPYNILYGFSNFMRFIMRNIVKYRVKVIHLNLKKAFPEKSDHEIKTLEKKAYKNLIDYIVEGIKAFTMSRKTIIKRHKLLNPELLDVFYKNKQSVIGVTAHYNNWEWGSLSASLQTPYDVAAFYKPLSNKHIDQILRKSRSRFGTKLVSIFETSKIFETYRNLPFIYLMAADQSPSKREVDKAYWIDFLGIKTAFLHGLEKHAMNNNYAVLYVDIRRIKRGFYELELSVLSENPKELKNGELTKRYANKLESIIKKEPENWLWSHKRWKHASTSISLDT
ncbi:MAG: lysophospholipid acyltransferase family protein [Salinivirgaceae bacterium]|nr:lysophospholipid acyltransferase family protein [Salinivirgaceae bacterium]